MTNYMPSVIGRSIAEAATAQSITCTVPTGTTAGNILVVAVCSADTNGVMPDYTGTGWTTISKSTATNSSPLGLYYRVVAAGDATSYTFAGQNTTGAGRLTAEMTLISNVNGTVLDVTPVLTTGGGTNIPLPGITTANANSLVLHTIGLAAASATDITLATGTTLVQDSTGTGRRLLTAYENATTAGFTGTRTFGETGTTGLGWSGISVAFRGAAYANYASAVTADNPLAYFHLEETGTLSTSSTIADSGSAGGTGTAVGTPSRIASGRPGAGTIGGTAMHWDNVTDTYVQHTGLTFTSSGDMTFETWYKRDTAYAATANTGTFLRFNGNGKAFEAGFNGATSALAVVAGSSVINTTISSGTPMDGQWHHVAVVLSSGNVTFYLDGVNVASGTGASVVANTGGTFQVGAFSTGIAATLDEPAVYNRALTQAQIANHYAAGTAVGSTPVTVTPPYIPISTGLSVPAPVVTATSPNSTNVVPVMSLNALTVPAPVITPGKGATVTPPAIALGTADMATAPTVLIAKVTNYLDTKDRSATTLGSGTSPSLPFGGGSGSGSGYAAYFGFGNVSLGANNTFLSATLNVYASAVAGVSMPYTVEKLTATLNEADHFALANTSTGVSGRLVAGWNQIDVSSILSDWLAGGTQYGISVTPTFESGNTGSLNIITKEGATGASAGQQPYLSMAYVQTPTPVSVLPPAMPLTLSAPAPAVAAVQNVSSVATVASLSLDAIAPGVSASVNVISTLPAMDALSLAFLGGVEKNPDYQATATVMTLSLSAPNAGVSVEYPVTVQAPFAYLGEVFTSPGTVNLTTNVLKVAPVMSMTIKWPGIYVESADRYVTKVQSTVDQYARWYKLNESSGSTVNDSAGLQVSPTRTDGLETGRLVGTIGYQVDGPFLRKAMHFNGLDSYIRTDGGWTVPYNAQGGGAGFVNNSYGRYANIEFSIRTTATDGTIFAGGGGSTSAFYQAAGPYNSGIELTLVGGQLYMIQGTSQFKVRATINDGEWHHVIVQGADSDQLQDNAMMGWINVDGKRILTRQGGWAGAAGLMPRSVMAKTNLVSIGNGSSAETGVSGYLAGELRDFIVRVKNYISPDQAQQLYYEWSNSLMVQPTPVTLTVTAPKPFSVKGNVKKMIAIYGVPGSWNSSTYNNMPLGTYRSQLSGLAIKHFQINGYGQQLDSTTFDANVAMNGNGNSSGYHMAKTVPFMQNGYLVYPVHIEGNIAYSADGVLNGEYDYTVGSGSLVDDETGKPRFIDLQKDLINLDDFDTVTVVNYPPEKKYYGFQSDHVNSAMQPEPTPEFFAGYNAVEYEVMRNNLRDSILEAAYNGMNLWIPEFHAAKHLGFIEEYDVHGTDAGVPGTFGLNRWMPNHAGSGDGTMNGDHRATNWAAQWLDNKHGCYGTPATTPDDPTQIIPDAAADYEPSWQVNQFHRIVATVPGLTDIPSWERTDVVQREAYDPWKLGKSHFAYDVMDRMSGLRIGDQVRLGASASESGFGIIVSGRGKIAGTVVAKEMDSYWGPYATRVKNPFKDNVLTIAAERGTTVRGRAIRGRAFMEFMDDDLTTTTIGIDDPAYFGNSDNAMPESTWAYDTGRERDIALQLFDTRFTFKPMTDGGVTRVSEFRASTTTINYLNYGDSMPMKYLPHISMQQRGLKWLAEDYTVSADDAHVYGPAMELTVSLPSVTTVANRELDVAVIGAMRLDLEVRQPKNYRSNDFSDKALPMSLSLEMHGTGAVVNATAMTLALTTPAVTLVAHGEKISVYLEGNPNVTLFMKEDN